MTHQLERSPRQPPATQYAQKSQNDFQLSQIQTIAHREQIQREHSESKYQTSYHQSQSPKIHGVQQQNSPSPHQFMKGSRRDSSKPRKVYIPNYLLEHHQNMRNQKRPGGVELGNVSGLGDIGEDGQRTTTIGDVPGPRRRERFNNGPRGSYDQTVGSGYQPLIQTSQGNFDKTDYNSKNNWLFDTNNNSIADNADIFDSDGNCENQNFDDDMQISIHDPQSSKKELHVGFKENQTLLPPPEIYLRKQAKQNQIKQRRQQQQQLQKQIQAQRQQQIQSQLASQTNYSYRKQSSNFDTVDEKRNSLPLTSIDSQQSPKKTFQLKKASNNQKLLSPIDSARKRRSLQTTQTRFPSLKIKETQTIVQQIHKEINAPKTSMQRYQNQKLKRNHNHTEMSRYDNKSKLMSPIKSQSSMNSSLMIPVIRSSKNKPSRIRESYTDSVGDKITVQSSLMIPYIPDSLKKDRIPSNDQTPAQNALLDQNSKINSKASLSKIKRKQSLAKILPNLNIWNHNFVDHFNQYVKAYAPKLRDEMNDEQKIQNLRSSKESLKVLKIIDQPQSFNKLHFRGSFSIPTQEKSPNQKSFLQINKQNLKNMKTKVYRTEQNDLSSLRKSKQTKAQNQMDKPKRQFIEYADYKSPRHYINLKDSIDTNQNKPEQFYARKGIPFKKNPKKVDDVTLEQRRSLINQDSCQFQDTNFSQSSNSYDDMPVISSPTNLKVEHVQIENNSQLPASIYTGLTDLNNDADVNSFCKNEAMGSVYTGDSAYGDRKTSRYNTQRNYVPQNIEKEQPLKKWYELGLRDQILPNDYVDKPNKQPLKKWYELGLQNKKQQNDTIENFF